MSFRFLNPRLVDEHPYQMDSVCYHGIGQDEAEILCRDLPPNLMRFLGWWYITPERHFLEWIGFVVTGIILLVLLGPKMGIVSSVSKASLPTTGNSSTSVINQSSLLKPMLWMKASTLLFYPYVSYTKLSWQGSYYPGRWLLFVGMPVGTLWIVSVIFCFSSTILALAFGNGHGNGRTRTDHFRSALSIFGTGTNHHCRNDPHSFRFYKIRYWLLEIWLSFLPILGGGLLVGLFWEAVETFLAFDPVEMLRSIRATGVVADDGENACFSYFCHALYLTLAPMVYVLIGELTMHPPPLAVSDNSSSSRDNNNNERTNSISHRLVVLRRLAVECAFRQAVGTAVATLYYMGIVTPVSIVAGLNVNFLLQGGDGEPNFRIYCVVRWFCYGWMVRFLLGVLEMVIGFAMVWIRGGEHEESSNIINNKGQ
mmetsp:Transcript_11235/g.23842  ORF Transcript_11235/g.23842 Transcript_11235/m.23842 type:complete len:425 (+) Transcript_11235:84-1358(+)